MARISGRVALPDPDLSKSQDGHPDLDLSPTQFLSRYYPPRDISLIVALVISTTIISTINWQQQRLKIKDPITAAIS